MPSSHEKICILGLGYIGLPSAAFIASRGHKVIGVDINEEVVKNVNRGNTHFYEPNLDKIVKDSIESKNLEARNVPCNADIFIICVPTPFKKSKDNQFPKPDISLVEEAALQIAPLLKENDLIILESTSPIGTTKHIKDLISSVIDPGINVSYAYCPERVLPGNIIEELASNDRIVGGIDEESSEKAYNFLNRIVDGEVLKTNSQTAEMCKLAENSYRDVNIAFANELSLICSENEIDDRYLIKIANRHPRVNILQPGTGVGGHCIAVDPWFLVSNNFEFSKLIRSAREVNEFKTVWVTKDIERNIKIFHDNHKRVPLVACFGIAFKPDVSDLRESPSLSIVMSLFNSNHNIIVVEPNIKNHEYLKIESYKKAIKEADILCFLVNHKEFCSKDVHDTNSKILLDYCGIYPE